MIWILIINIWILNNFIHELNQKLITKKNKNKNKEYKIIPFSVFNKFTLFTTTIQLMKNYLYFNIQLLFV